MHTPFLFNLQMLTLLTHHRARPVPPTAKESECRPTHATHTIKHAISMPQTTNYRTIPQWYSHTPILRPKAEMQT